MRFDIKNAGFSRARVLSVAKRLSSSIESLKRTDGYSGELASFHLPFDSGLLKRVERAISEKRALKPSLLVVAGIGGSNLGTIAVQEALAPGARVRYADTVDPDHVGSIADEVESELKRGRRVLLVVVSKSGSTTETIANFSVLFRLLKRYRKDAEDCVVVVTDKGSNLWDYALQEGFLSLEIPKLVGGRYSVLSAVGLFPLGFLGVDVRSLRKGARVMRRRCEERYDSNPAALGAALLYLNSKAGRNIYDHFIFSKRLESLGKWYRQLLGESIGKEFDVSGKRVNVGITPTVSVGSVDLHSVGQLDLGGPDDKVTNFVTAPFNRSLRVPSSKALDSLVPNIRGKSYSFIMDAILEGTATAYRKLSRPFTRTHIEKGAFGVGEFLQWKMVETFFLGRLFGVNPFDQPNVESYKSVTRKLLRHQL